MAENPDLHLEQKYCYCGGPDIGRMIACENQDCIIEWFHTDCLMQFHVANGIALIAENCLSSSGKGCALLTTASNNQ